MASDALTQLGDVLGGTRQVATSPAGTGPNLADMAELVAFVEALVKVTVSGAVPLVTLAEKAATGAPGAGAHASPMQPWR